MMNRKWTLFLAGVLVACSSIYSHAGRQDEITLLMVPREEGSVRLGKDIASRYPTLLISYAVGQKQNVSLHGWTGLEWVNITLDAFHEGGFFKQGPNSALVIEKAGSPVPPSLIPPAGWCADASKITTTEIRPLLHLLGQYYDFSYKDWQWFAKRYNMEMDDINPEGLNVSWYHRPMSEHVTGRDQQGGSDLQYWVSIRRPAVITEVQEPVAEPEAEPVPSEDVPQDGLLTNDAPAAVILGADDAVEEETEPSPEPAEAEVPAEEEENAPEPEAEEPSEEMTSENAEESGPEVDASTAAESEETP